MPGEPHDKKISDEAKRRLAGGLEGTRRLILQYRARLLILRNAMEREGAPLPLAKAKPFESR